MPGPAERLDAGAVQGQRVAPGYRVQRRRVGYPLLLARSGRRQLGRRGAGDPVLGHQHADGQRIRLRPVIHHGHLAGQPPARLAERHVLEVVAGAHAGPDGRGDVQRGGELAQLLIGELALLVQLGAVPGIGEVSLRQPDLVAARLGPADPGSAQHRGERLAERTEDARLEAQLGGAGTVTPARGGALVLALVVRLCGATFGELAVGEVGEAAADRDHRGVRVEPPALDQRDLQPWADDAVEHVGQLPVGQPRAGFTVARQHRLHGGGQALGEVGVVEGLDEGVGLQREATVARHALQGLLNRLVHLVAAADVVDERAAERLALLDVCRGVVGALGSAPARPARLLAVRVERGVLDPVR